MRVLLLTPRPQCLAKPLIEAGDDYVVSHAKSDLWPKDIDYVVSFGYRHKIPAPMVVQYAGRMINIHLSVLPWNRGADPNFWSWFDDTPKGVSFHLISETIDRGPLVMVGEVKSFHPNSTLRSSYDFLTEFAGDIFAKEWRRFRSGNYLYIEQQQGKGSYHKSSDKDPWMSALPLKWDTPVTEVTAMGKATRQ